MNEQLAMVVHDRSRFVLSNNKSREKSLEFYVTRFDGRFVSRKESRCFDISSGKVNNETSQNEMHPKTHGSKRIEDA